MANPVSLETAGIRAVAAGTARLMFYTLLAIVLMSMDYRGAYIQRIQSMAGSLVEPALLLIDWPVSGFRSLGWALADRAELSSRLDQLQREQLEMAAGLAVVDDLARENARLRALLDTTERLEYSMLVAELAAVDMDPFAHRIVVKRGRSDGIEIGMPVIDAFGVVGQVEHVYRYSARVILLSDPDHALPVQILPDGERTIAYGSGALERLRLNDLPMNSEIEAGQLVVTSGLGGQFPAGLSVGRVTQITRLPGQPFATADIQPSAAMTQNRHVLILIQTESVSDVDSEDEPEQTSAAVEAAVSEGATSESAARGISTHNTGSDQTAGPASSDSAQDGDADGNPQP